MDRVVVSGAEQHAVVDGGGSACSPGDDVVGFAPGCRHSAVGERAALVAGHERPSQVRWEETLGSADVQDLTLAAEDEREDVGVAGKLADAAGTYLLGED